MAYLAMYVVTTAPPSIFLALSKSAVLPFRKGAEKNKVIVAETISNTHAAASGKRFLLGRIGFLTTALIKTNEPQKRHNPIYRLLS